MPSTTSLLNYRLHEGERLANVCGVTAGEPEVTLHINKKILSKFMFVTSQVSMPATSGFIHIKYVIKQYKKTLKHMPRSLQYSYI